MDESTAYKHHTSQRSKAMAEIRPHFKYRVAMSGTPMPNGLLDIWHQVFLVDDGEHLGGKYYAFRAATHEPVPVTRDISEWVEKPEAREAIADILADMTIRFSLEECIDMPEHVVSTRSFDLSTKSMRHYKTMLDNALLELDSGEITAVHAAALTTKLLQIASGSVYGDGTAHTLDTTRYDLVAELCAERPHTLVAFLWHHQREQLIQALERAGISNYAVIDSNAKGVPDIVRRFQDGQYRVLLAHPQSASHGLTLTRATTTIWASPTYDAERFRQFNRRIYRAGQKQRTETILIQATDTIDSRVYDRVQGKMDDEDSLLSLVKSLRSTMKEVA
jgi:SNF2 family DNA or RNA helicase